ncbi:MAG: hypothetical protein JWN72_978, partial [Thermoleophilia bacterium]|nr:hypothetical protein [Thermoleophilia bacterium]
RRSGSGADDGSGRSVIVRGSDCTVA